MSDASDAFGSPVVRSVNGEDVEFPRITGRDYGQLEGAIREKLMAVDRELLDECQITGKERFEKLRESANQPITMGHVDAALQTHEFARKALEVSLKKAKHPSPAAVIDALPVAEASDLARVLVGFLVPFDRTSQSSGTGSPQRSDATTPAPTPAA